MGWCTSGFHQVPADARVVQLCTASLAADQACLTGESEAVHKNEYQVSEDADLVDKTCALFAGTSVVNGACTALVTRTGMNTEIGYKDATFPRVVYAMIQEPCSLQDICA